VDFLCAGVVWKKCKGGDKELERGFKRSNVFGKIQHRNAKYHCFVKSCGSSG
jgi:hypothetical protein